MSGQGVGKPPRTDAQWARDVEQRLNALESASTVRVGNWVLTSQNGNLQATAPGKGTLYLATSEGSPSVVAASPSTAVTGTSITWQDIWNLFTGGSSSTATTTPEWITEISTWLDNEWNSFLTPTSPLNWGNFLNQLPAWLTPSTLNLGAITTQPVNLLADPRFNAALNAPSGRWTRDNTVYRTSGWSVHITANGVEGSIRSNLIKVTDGQEISMTMHGAVQGLTGTGTLLELTALPFTINDSDDEIAGTPVSMGAIGIPGGSLSDWTAAPTGTAYGFTLTGSWVTEDCDAVALRITVHAAATAGDIWWDDGDFTFTGTLPPGAITGLVGQLDTLGNNLNSVFTAFATAGTPEAFQSAVTGLLALFHITDPTVLQSSGTAWIQSLWASVTSNNILNTGLVAFQTDMQTAQTWLQQIADIFDGQSVVPINTWVSQVQAWWAAITGQTQNLTSGGALPATAISGPLAQTQVTGLPAINTAVGANSSNISTFITKFQQIGQISEGQIVTAIDNDVQNFKDWWASLTGQTQNLTSGGALPSTAISGQLPATQVTGPQGVIDVETAFTSSWNQFATAMGWNPAGGDAAISTVASWFGATAQSSSSAAALSHQNANIINKVDNQPVGAGQEATVESNMDWRDAQGLSLSATGNQMGGFLRVSQAKTFGFVQWLGFIENSGLTGFYINFYKMSTSGVLTWLYTSANLVGALSSVYQWNVYNIPSGHMIAAAAGDVIAVEFQVKGPAGAAYYVYGNGNGGPGNHPISNIKQPGFEQNWGSTTPASIPAASIAWNSVHPYFGLGVGTANIPRLIQQPARTDYLSAATGTWTPPPWMVAGDKIDLVVLGGGGGGGWLKSGSPGTWATRTLTVGTDVPVGAALTYQVGLGGLYSSWDGTDSLVKYGTTTLVDGAAGSNYVQAGQGDQSPGNITFGQPAPDGTTYFGGGQVALKQNGSSPGGAGSWTADANAVYNTEGADGQVSITAYQGP